eukprot:269276-Rhodomonas_salina.2
MLESKQPMELLGYERRLRTILNRCRLMASAACASLGQIFLEQVCDRRAQQSPFYPASYHLH